jgi:single-strand DNA-binding protein
MLPNITGEFRVVAGDPELRFAPSGVAVCTMRVVANSRKKQGDEWVDDKVCWLKVTCFKRLAENVAESIKDKNLITVSGRLQTEEWEDKEGAKRQSYVIVADNVGLALNLSPAKSLGSSEGGSGASRSRGTESGGTDPWQMPDDEPPF